MADETVMIPLTRGLFAVVDAADAPGLLRFKWQATASGTTHYARRAVPQPGGPARYLQMHRQIMDVPESMEVDHRDGDGLNNRRENLRVCTHQQNMANQGKRRHNTSGYRGVCRLKGTRAWVANLAGRYLGCYETAELAARAVDTAARRQHGEYARLNFPDDAVTVEPRLGQPRKVGAAGHIGIKRHRKGWTAWARIGGKVVYAGLFKTVEQALAAQAETAERHEKGANAPSEPSHTRTEAGVYE